MMGVIGYYVLGDLVELNTQYSRLVRSTNAVAAAILSTCKSDASHHDEMIRFAGEFLKLNGNANANFQVFLCDNDFDGLVDDPATFPLPQGSYADELRKQFKSCGTVGTPVSGKYAWVYSTEEYSSRVVGLLGASKVVLTAVGNSQGMTQDVVVIVDTSESMESFLCVDGYVGSSLRTCSSAQKIEAGIQILLDSFDFPYDRIALITLDENDSPRAKVSLFSTGDKNLISSDIHTLLLNSPYKSNQELHASPSYVDDGISLAADMLGKDTGPATLPVVLLLADNAAEMTSGIGCRFTRNEGVYTVVVDLENIGGDHAEYSQACNSFNVVLSNAAEIPGAIDEYVIKARKLRW